MSFFLPGRFSGTLLMTGVVALGLATSNQAIVCLQSVPHELSRADAPPRTVRHASWSANGRELFVRSLGNLPRADEVTIQLVRLYDTETGRESGKVDSTPPYDS